MHRDTCFAKPPATPIWRSCDKGCGDQLRRGFVAPRIGASVHGKPRVAASERQDGGIPSGNN